MILTVQEPVRQQAMIQSNVADFARTDEPSQLRWHHKAKTACNAFLQPSILVLCFAGSIRNAGKFYLKIQL